jgi:hypothetical protein
MRLSNKTVLERAGMEKIPTTIKREWLREIVARRKPVEYREIKPYWVKRLERVRTPFLLCLINGMQQNAPRLTVIVNQIRKNSRSGRFELHLGKIVEVRFWDTRRERPLNS